MWESARDAAGAKISSWNERGCYQARCESCWLWRARLFKARFGERVFRDSKGSQRSSIPSHWCFRRMDDPKMFSTDFFRFAKFQVMVAVLYLATRLFLALSFYAKQCKLNCYIMEMRKKQNQLINWCLGKFKRKKNTTEELKRRAVEIQRKWNYFGWFFRKGRLKINCRDFELWKIVFIDF